MGLLWKKVKNNLLYAGLTKEEYLTIRPDFCKANIKTSAIYLVFMILFMSASAIWSYYSEENIVLTAVYGAGAFLSLLTLILNRYAARRDYRFERPVILSTELLMGMAAAVVGALDYRNSQGVLIIVVFFIIIIAFNDRPVHPITMIVLIEIVFLILSYTHKTPFFFKKDLNNVCIYGLLAIALGLGLMRVKARLQIGHYKDKEVNDRLEAALNEARKVRVAEEEKKWTERELEKEKKLTAQLEEQHQLLQLYEQIFAKAPDAVNVGVVLINKATLESIRYITDNNGVFIKRNCGRWDRYLESLLKYVNESDRNRVSNELSKRKLLELKEGDILTVPYDGISLNEQGVHRHYVSTVQARVIDGQPSIIVFSRDDTKNVEDRKAWEAAEQKALQEAKEASRAKTTFLNDMSHDIRTPLNGIIGYADLAGQFCNDAVKVKEYIDKIQVSGKYLQALINDILDMSRIESGKVLLEIRNNNLREILNEVKTIFDRPAEEKKITFTVEAEELRNEDVMCDELRLEQVLNNLVSNAIKYTPDGGRVSLKLRQLDGDSSDNARYEFKVSDNGIGISRDFQKQLFESFARERNTTVSRIKGTGLGLAITKKLLDLMKGNIECSSRQGEGSTFTVTVRFPICKERDQRAKEKEAIKAENIKYIFDNKVYTGKKALIAEDNEMNTEILETILKEAGFETETAADGAEALEIMKKSEPGDLDIIFMDIQMPVMDGYEATKQIRQLGSSYAEQIPIIAMTANAFDEDRIHALSVGMNDHASKPIDKISLFMIIEKYLKVSESGKNE